MASEDALIDTDTQLGDVTIAGPYIDALEAVNEYIVTLARAVYRCDVAGVNKTTIFLSKLP